MVSEVKEAIIKPKLDHNLTLAGLLVADADRVIEKLERAKDPPIKGLYSFEKKLPNGKVYICNGIEFPNAEAVDLLLYLLYKVEQSGWDRKIRISGLNQLAKEVFSVKKIGKGEKKLIERILTIWKFHGFYFVESFIWEGSKVTRLFGVVDDWRIESKGRGKPAELYITFNEEFIEICKNTTWYRRPNWEEIKKLRKEIAKSLYILAINYKPSEKAKSWKVYIDKDLRSWYRNALNSLANPKYLKPYYVLKRLNGAIEEINQKTNLQMELQETPQGNYCIDIKERAPSGTCKLELPFDSLPEDSKALLIAYLSANSDKKKINNIEGFLRSLSSKELKSYLKEAKDYFENLINSRNSEQLIKELNSWAEDNVPDGVRKAVFKEGNIVNAEESLDKIIFYCRSLSLAKFYNKEYSDKLTEYFGKEVEFKPI